MSDENTRNAAPTFSVHIGKEIDAALGDVIRGLLKKPAEEAGNVLADGIGIIGDRVKRKRELNASLGIEQVRKKLEAENIDLEDITPPKEEELHLLINGLSLSDDETVRDMWAGLFAKSLEPNSNVYAERPFISVLQSLSPTDAKIIAFLAFIIKIDNEVRQDVKYFSPKNLRNITDKEKDEALIIQKERLEIQQNAINAIMKKGEDFGLSANFVPNWVHNLMRQGVVERTPVQQPSVNNIILRDQRELSRYLGQLEQQVKYLEESAKRNSSPPKKLFSRSGRQGPIQLEIILSDFGRRFAEACGLL